MKIPNKIELQQISLNHSSDIISLCKISLISTKIVLLNHILNDATLASDNPLRLRKNLFSV